VTFSCPGCAAAVPGVPRFASRNLVWSTAITLGLIGVLYALARWSG